MKVNEIIVEDMTRRGFLATAAALAAPSALAKNKSQANRPIGPAYVTNRPAAGVTPPDKFTRTQATQSSLYNTIKTEAMKNGIKNPVELAQFLAQISAETGDFKNLGEVGNTAKYAKRGGNQGLSDAQRFKGRGYIQLTGRDNYEAASREIMGDKNILLDDPSIAAHPLAAADIAIWYWKTRVKPQVRNIADTISVTRAIVGPRVPMDQIMFRDREFRNRFLPELQAQAAGNRNRKS